MFFQHVTLVEGLIAEMATMFSHSWCIIFMMFEVNIKLLLFNKQFSAASNLNRILQNYDARTIKNQNFKMY